MRFIVGSLGATSMRGNGEAKGYIMWSLFLIKFVDCNLILLSANLGLDGIISQLDYGRALMKHFIIGTYAVDATTSLQYMKQDWIFRHRLASCFWNWLDVQVEDQGYNSGLFSASNGFHLDSICPVTSERCCEMVVDLKASRIWRSHQKMRGHQNQGLLMLVGGPQEENLNARDAARNSEHGELSSQTASQILWATGSFSGRIPSGFYSVIPEKRIKDHFDNIPSPDELWSLGMEGHKADIILVDTEKDKKLASLRQLTVALVKGLSSNPAAMIKKIAGLVFDVYKRPNSELSPAKSSQEELIHAAETCGVQLLSQIRHGSCRPRAILFKVLADAVGLDSKLMVGLPGGAAESVDSYKHMSVVVVLNSVELLVDLMRFPGQLIPLSTKAIYMSHVSAAGESDSAENDSCDSPLEPNSPLCGLSDRLDCEGIDHDEGVQFLYQRRLEASTNFAGPSIRNAMLRPTAAEAKLSRRKAVAEQRTASSRFYLSVNFDLSVNFVLNIFLMRSGLHVLKLGQMKINCTEHQVPFYNILPEHPLFRARGRSMLGDRQSFREYADGVAASRSDGGSTSDTRRIRRRSISITPEIGDDIV
ncbi:hypothetical protein ACLOJK_010562, partial [Asimina triloba]